ncbi:hypothetical protein Pint_13211 [Pistacia integerrima]|uniref:Uncharacterized protein n=1 Tax=Pistacia integerrima TaxID=434235 RepID=A0ACC0YAZ1_9ROSI|nr:hypothetical protein Pint_13211 [Pistacia integerrima]
MHHYFFYSHVLLGLFNFFYTKTKKVDLYLIIFFIGFSGVHQNLKLKSQSHQNL